jgi:hypothetical protein
MCSWSKIKKRRNIKCDASFEELVGGTKRAVTFMSMLLEQGFEETGYTWMNYATEWTCDHAEPMARMDTSSLSTILLTTHYTNFEPLFHHGNTKKGLRLY